MRRGEENWSNPRVLAIFAVLFICGVVIGSALTTSVFHWRLHHTTANSAEATELGLLQLREKLHLTADQERTVTKELDEYAKYYENIEEQREDVAELGKRNILAVLNPEQKRVFLSMFRTSTLPTRSTH